MAPPPSTPSRFFDAARVVAQGGFGQDLKLLPFASRDAYEEDDLLVGTRDAKYGKSEMTRLHGLARAGNARRVAVLLRVSAGQKPAHRDIDEKDGRYTPLHAASEAGHVEVARLLLDDGASPNIISYRSNASPLHLAAKHGHARLVVLLLDRGVDVNQESRYPNATPLLFASEAGHFEVARLLLDRGASLNTTYHTPLKFAFNLRHIALMSLLIARGADMQALDGFTDRAPLHSAAHAGELDMVRFFVEWGADIMCKDRDDIGARTPLHLAAHAGHEAAVRYLVGRGADVNALDVWGNNPCTLARYGKHASVANFLAEHGSTTQPLVPEFRVFVRPLFDGEWTTILCNPFDYVEDIRRRIASMNNVSPQSMSLEFRGRLLWGHTCLAQNRLQDGSVLTPMLSMKGD
jgi:ankyrin repeat protein